MTIRDRNILITGGAVRIGAVIADALTAEGARPIIYFHQSDAEAHKLAHDLQRNYKVDAEAIIYLLNAKSVTGQIIFVDGGQHLCH